MAKIGFNNEPDKRDSRMTDYELDQMMEHPPGLTAAEFADARRMLTQGAKKPKPVSSKVVCDIPWGEPYQSSYGGGAHNLFNGSSCADTHPPLPIEVAGTVYYVHGGSATRRAPAADVDVFVGLDGMMFNTDRALPWNPGVEFLYKIQDMNAPADAVTFVQLIAYLEIQILRGKKVFIGCIGGHGRTGTVLSALVQHMTGNLDATSYVRQHYCKKAVESKAQVDFLHKHFGITKVEGTKSSYSKVASNLPAKKAPHLSRGGKDSFWEDEPQDKGQTAVYPLAGKCQLYGDNKIENKP